MTIEECWNIYRSEHLPTIIDKRRQEAAWKRLSVLAKTKVENVTPAVILRYVTKRGGGATAKRELATLRASIRYCAKTGRIPAAPIIFANIVEKPRLRWCTIDEMRTLIVAAEAAGIGDFVRIMVLTGQRPGAVLTLRWSQVDEHAQVVDFNRGVARAKKAGVLPIKGSLAAILDRLRETTGGVGYVLWGRKLRDIRRPWHNAITAAGLGWVTPHVLRHSVATNLVKEGVPLNEVSKLLGHTSIVTTERVYVKYTPDYLTNSVGRLSASFGV